jgi:hypothetical protein
MGIYSGVLAPPGVGFWFVVIVGALLTFGPLVVTLLRGANQPPGRDRKSAVAVSLFSAFTTILLIHFYGDQRVLGWVYDTPDRSSLEGWQSLIVPFGPVFWLLVAVEAVVSFLALRHRHGGWATLSLIVTLFMIQFVTGVPVIPWIIRHWDAAAVLFGLWVAVGCAWSFFYKWDNLVATHRAWYDEIRAAWLKDRDFTEETEFTLEDKADWEIYFEDRKTRDDGEVVEARPKYRRHKSELLGWATLWPVSVFETFLYDWLAQLFDHLYQRLGAVLEWIMVRRWKGTEDHMLSAEERVILERERQSKPREVVYRK